MPTLTEKQSMRQRASYLSVNLMCWPKPSGYLSVNSTC